MEAKQALVRLMISDRLTHWIYEEGGLLNVYEELVSSSEAFQTQTKDYFSEVNFDPFPPLH